MYYVLNSHCGENIYAIATTPALCVPDEFVCENQITHFTTDGDTLIGHHIGDVELEYPGWAHIVDAAGVPVIK